MNVIDTDARFVIDPVSGDIANNSLKETIARYSHNSEVFTFEIPRNIGHDPVECNLIEIHYLNINARNKTETSEGIYKVNDICECAEDDKKAVFTWKIDDSATAFAGTLSFSIHFKCIDSEGKCLYRLPIKTYSKITVTDAIDNSGVVMEDNQDIIAEWEARISKLEYNLPIVIHVQGTGDQYIVQGDFNWDETMQRIKNGGRVICKSYDTYLPMTQASETDPETGVPGSIIFSAALPYNIFTYVEIFKDGLVKSEILPLDGGTDTTLSKVGQAADARVVGQKIGDISAALDHIIEIQEELIGS